MDSLLTLSMESTTRIRSCKMAAKEASARGQPWADTTSNASRHFWKSKAKAPEPLGLLVLWQDPLKGVHRTLTQERSNSRSVSWSWGIAKEVWGDRWRLLLRLEKRLRRRFGCC